MKVWGKIRLGGRIIKDAVAEAGDFGAAVVAVCEKFDLSKPVMLEKHKNEIRLFNLTVFLPEDFIEPVSFDSLEIENIVSGKQKHK